VPPTFTYAPIATGYWRNFDHEGEDNLTWYAFVSPLIGSVKMKSGASFGEYRAPVAIRRVTQEGAVAGGSLNLVQGRSEVLRIAQGDAATARLDLWVNDRVFNEMVAKAALGFLPKIMAELAESKDFVIDATGIGYSWDDTSESRVTLAGWDVIYEIGSNPDYPANPVERAPLTPANAFQIVGLQSEIQRLKRWLWALTALVAALLALRLFR
jgi:hypothetical protein